MSAALDKAPELEPLLAKLLSGGTWLASTVIGVGLLLGWLEPRGGAAPSVAWGARVVTAGVALFVLLPVVRVIVMAIAFARARSYRFAGVAIVVLAIILAGLLVGTLMSGSRIAA